MGTKLLTLLAAVGFLFAVSPITPKAGGAKPPKKDLEIFGTIVPARVARVAPVVSGRIVALNVRVGDKVKKGEVVARLEDTLYKAEYEKAVARLMRARASYDELKKGARQEELKQAQADIQESKAGVELTRADYVRLVEIMKKAPQAIAQGEVSKAKAALETAMARLEKLQAAYALLKAGPKKERLAVAQAEIAIAEAGLSKAKYLLDSTQLRAPIDGVILKTNAHLGDLVNPSAFQAQPLVYELADLSVLEVPVVVTKENIERVTLGQKCEVSVIHLGVRILKVGKGVVSRLAPVLDNFGSLEGRVRVELPKNNTTVKPGMVAKVRFLESK
jgi:multidrug efflux pump subunit AcrA (membrane-fusion protein)